MILPSSSIPRSSSWRWRSMLDSDGPQSTKSSERFFFETHKTSVEISDKYYFTSEVEILLAQPSIELVWLKLKLNSLFWHKSKKQKSCKHWRGRRRKSRHLWKRLTSQPASARAPSLCAVVLSPHQQQGIPKRHHSSSSESVDCDDANL